MSQPETKIIIHTAMGKREFSESDFLENPAKAAGFLTLRSTPFEGWQTAYSLDISPADIGFNMLMLAVGEHVETADGLAFRLSVDSVGRYSDFNS